MIAAEELGSWTTKTDGVYQLLRRRVLDGTLAPGAVIEQEAMAASLAVSTTPLREALRRLEAEGLLVQVAHREVKVPDLSAREINEIYLVRLQLDPYAIELGATNATDGQRAVVESLRQGIAQKVGTEYVWQHRDLHRAMYSASGNSVLSQTLDRLWERSVRYRVILFAHLDISGNLGPQSLANLDKTVQAFLRGDGETAKELLTSSIERARQLHLDGFQN